MKVVQINAVYGEKSTGSIVRDLDLLIQEKMIRMLFIKRHLYQQKMVFNWEI